LDPLVSIDKLFVGMLLSDSGKALVKMAGGHPGTLRLVKDVLKQNPKEDDLPKLIRLVGVMAKNWFVPYYDALPLLRSAVCSVPVQRTQKIMSSLTTDDVRSSGYCSYLHVISEPSRLIPVLTPFQLVHYFKDFDDVLGDKFRDSFRARKDQYFFGGLNFEWFHSTFECFRRMLWSDKSLGRVEYTTMRQLYQMGGVFADEFEDSDVRVFDTYALEEVHPLKFTPYFVSNGELTSMFLWLN
jgi:hypothetical protein